MSHEDRDKMLRKLEKLLQVDSFLSEFSEFTNETSWNKRFDIPLAVFLEMCVDPNLKIFMGMHTRGDLLKGENKPDRGQDRKALYSPTPGKTPGMPLKGGELKNVVELV